MWPLLLQLNDPLNVGRPRRPSLQDLEHGETQVLGQFHLLELTINNLQVVHI